MKLNFYTHDYYGNGDNHLYWVPLRRTRTKIKAIPTVPGRALRARKAVKFGSDKVQSLDLKLTFDDKLDLLLDGFNSATDKDMEQHLNRYWNPRFLKRYQKRANVPR